MPFEIQCPQCGKSLRVPDARAGKKGSCPGCQTPITIPIPVGRLSIPSVPVQAPVRAIPQPQERGWFLQDPSGQIFGPVPKSELDQWVAEGCVTADSAVWQEGDQHARHATELYSSEYFPNALGTPRIATADSVFSIEIEPTRSSYQNDPRSGSLGARNDTRPVHHVKRKNRDALLWLYRGILVAAAIFICLPWVTVTSRTDIDSDRVAGSYEYRRFAGRYGQDVPRFSHSSSYEVSVHGASTTWGMLALFGAIGGCIVSFAMPSHQYSSVTMALLGGIIAAMAVIVMVRIESVLPASVNYRDAWGNSAGTSTQLSFGLYATLVIGLVAIGVGFACGGQSVSRSQARRGR